MFFRICLLVCLVLVVVHGRITNSEPFLTEKFIDDINSAQSTWKAAPSKFMSWSERSIKRLMGVRPEYIEQHKLLTSIEHEVPNDLPDSFDARDQWPNCTSIKEIRDQGSCGSCWAVAAVEAITDRICIYSKGAQNFHISAEDLVACCFSCGHGCGGGYPRAAWEYYKGTGIVTGGNYNTTEGCLPYEIEACDHLVSEILPPCGPAQPTPTCTKKCRDGYPIPFEKDKHHGRSVYSVGRNPSQIETEIYTNGPVEAVFTVYTDFLTYKSGVYKHTSGSLLGGHAVKILGWGVQDSTPYWLVANSWNEDWGEKGYFKIQRGNDECGIENGIVAGTPKLD